MKKIYLGLFILYFSAWALFFSIAISNVMPNSPLKFPEKLTSTVTEVFPQGWGFFSKDPREDYFYALDLETNEIATSWPNMTWDNYLGLSRFGRSQGIELGRLYTQVGGEQVMNECNDTPLQCLEEEDAIKVTNDSPSPTMVGDIAIVKQETVPWAWAGNVEKRDMPSKIVRLQINVPNE